MKYNKTGMMDDLIAADEAKDFPSQNTSEADPHAEDRKLFAKAIREAWDRKFERDLAEICDAPKSPN